MSLCQISNHGLTSDLEYLKEAYLLVGLRNYSTKSILRIRNEKVYVSDVIQGLLSVARETHCDNLFLLTDSDYQMLEVDGKCIKIVPFQEWLLAKGKVIK